MDQNPAVPDRTSRTGDIPPQDQGQAFLAYDGKGSRLFQLSLKMAGLSLLTAAIYRFWGKTRIRRYLWSSISIFGDRLEYTGTGKELFLGFLVALALLIPLIVLLGTFQIYLLADWAQYEALVEYSAYAILGFLSGVAYYRARHYRFSRTRWRGIRFGQTGSAMEYAVRLVGYGAVALITLGIMRPLIDCGLQRYAVNNTWLGNARFSFDGKTGDLIGRWVLCVVLAPFTLGLSLLWYSVFQARYFASKTRLEELSFDLSVTFGDYFDIYARYFAVLAVIGIIVASNFSTLSSLNPIALGVMIVVALLLWPMLKLIMVTHRFIALSARRLQALGTIHLDAIVQNAQINPQTGEGLADALDVGGGIEIGF